VNTTALSKILAFWVGFFVLGAAAAPSCAVAQSDPFGWGFYSRALQIFTTHQDRRDQEWRARQERMHEEQTLKNEQREMVGGPAKLPRQRLSNEAHLSNNPWAREAQRRRTGPVQVELFVADHCPACRLMEQYLNDAGVPYSLFFLAPGSETEKQYFAQMGSGIIPAIRINGRVVRGYQPEAVRRIVLEEKKLQTD